MCQRFKFTELGLSIYAAWEVAMMWRICDKNGYVKPTIYQGMYNAITRSIENELFPCCRSFGIRLAIYNPLAGGFFAGKIMKPDDPIEEGGRFDPNHPLGAMYRERYIRSSFFKALEVVKEALKGHPDITLVSVAARWLQHHSGLQPEDRVILGASSIDQIEMNCSCSEEGPLPENILSAVDLARETVKAELNAHRTGDDMYHQHGVVWDGTVVFLIAFLARLKIVRLDTRQAIAL
ncbi:uncharacterized protein MELLADRAFT_88442 [Melampsora larici-populina 98AG31]|uniref:NADP-dependent oxidoreductase domain-containing protein n=1 Tax=Melampsora larici-populina (strain 98AG31 / pathotype 3-4-7) TaxID=747676 RepID=F4RRR2_MELLP|nr:uncharacterized protein MELLADRAFT_88442 [Melampsora larici-populina 98AG31]EGG04974.1 hypothetical protein MELLADRAFT_88442 [Melampsora larici-populina 98AG31]